MSCQQAETCLARNIGTGYSGIISSNLFIYSRIQRFSKLERPGKGEGRHCVASGNHPLSIADFVWAASTSSWTRSIDLKYLTVLTRSSERGDFNKHERPHAAALRTSRCVLVHDDQCPGMRLQSRQRPEMIHTMLNSHTKREGLSLASDDYDDLA